MGEEPFGEYMATWKETKTKQAVIRELDDIFGTSDDQGYDIQALSID